jgi:cyclohexa-1,5-dienecarbonyl-CoA hydratase
LRERLAEVERLYLEKLMKTRDANEGLDAFLAKRAPNGSTADDTPAPRPPK